MCVCGGKGKIDGFVKDVGVDLCDVVLCVGFDWVCYVMCVEVYDDGVRGVGEVV